jgi:hypothetical protein
MPTAVLIDRRGSIVRRKAPQADIAAWHRPIDMLLANS